MSTVPAWQRAPVTHHCVLGAEVADDFTAPGDSLDGRMALTVTEAVGGR